LAVVGEKGRARSEAQPRSERAEIAIAVGESQNPARRGRVGSAMFLATCVLVELSWLAFLVYLSGVLTLLS
jgi:hypothetical protein